MVKMQILVASLNKGFSFIEVIVTLLIISLVGSSFYIFFQNFTGCDHLKNSILNQIFQFPTSKGPDKGWPFQGRSSPIHYVMQAANRQPGFRLRASVSWMCSLAYFF